MLSAEKSIMKKATYCWMAAGLSCGMLASLATVAVQTRSWRAFWKRSPVIDYPAYFDLGEHEKGDVVVTPFTIANRGDAELLIDEITSNCGCTGMEREENGRYISLQSLRLKAGEEAHLVMRVSVGGPLGFAAHNIVEFRTNDPQQPTARIEVVVARVSGGIITTPETVVFGTVPVGGKARQLVDIWDPAESPREVKRVTSNSSKGITVRLITAGESPKTDEMRSKGVLVGRLEVTLNTDHPRRIDDTVLIAVAGREEKPDKLPVVGRVAALFEMSPPLLVLPRSTSNGRIYSATCLCRSISGKTFSLTVDSLPTGVTAKVLSEAAAGERAVQITLDPHVGKEQKLGQRQTIRFRAIDGANEAVVDLPIILQK